MKCKVCNNREVEYIVSPKCSGEWQPECEECENDGITAGGYWIGIPDYKFRKAEWISHLMQKNWFDLEKFTEAVNEV
jgi:hypothetical protein